MQSSYWHIEELPGLTGEEQADLKSRGILTTQHLLMQTQSLQGKDTLAGQLQLNPQHVRKWSALADLARIPSLGCQYCGLVLHSGIASVSQLRDTPIHRLHRQVVRLQVSTIGGRDLCPPIELVQQWIQQARSLS
ncbi:MAG: hypothetical protein N5P05_002428 [Chroococcopsis gigantea SAG 12.99]|jgi:hypothetical protein|nr:hypothetical protein [Chroococcopsis gigantea SAG 12.99]